MYKEPRSRFQVDREIIYPHISYPKKVSKCLKKPSKDIRTSHLVKFGPTGINKTPRNVEFYQIGRKLSSPYHLPSQVD